MTVELHPFPPAFVAFLRESGKRLATIERVKSKRQWMIAERVIAEWEALPKDVQDELHKEGYCYWVAWYMNQGQPYNVTAESGETIDWWCKVVATYQNLPVLDEWKEALSFDHFAKAKMLYNKELVTAPDKALAIAYNERLSAEAMVKRFTDPPQTEQWVKDIREKWPEHLWSAAYHLHRMNGNREQAEYHLMEFERLRKEDMR